MGTSPAPPSVLHNTWADRHQRGSVPQRGSWRWLLQRRTPANTSVLSLCLRGPMGAEALVQEAPLLPSSFQAADGRHTLHTARRERKQLFPLLFPRDEVPADGGGKKKLPLCSAGLLTSNCREARNDAFLFVFHCLCGPFLARSTSRPVWVSFSGCQSWYTIA